MDGCNAEKNCAQVSPSNAAGYFHMYSFQITKQINLRKADADVLSVGHRNGSIRV